MEGREHIPTYTWRDWSKSR